MSPISVSTAPYDGYPVPVALDSIARCGGKFVEPAFIAGYTEPFDESAFEPRRSREYAAWLAASGLGCLAMSSHIDLGAANAVDVFQGRMSFAKAIGATVIATNAAIRSREQAFWQNIERLARIAEDLNVVIGLENPGDGRDNLVNVASDGRMVVDRIGSPNVRLNYDPANLASHRPNGPDPAADAVESLDRCAHFHVKDVTRNANGWFFTPIGEGDLDFEIIFAGLHARPDLPISLELPLRLHRAPDAQPIRRPAPVPLPDVESAVSRSLRTIERRLAGTATSSISPAGRI